MSKDAGSAQNAQLKTPNTLIIELVNQQDSNYFLDASEAEGMEGAMPKALSAPSVWKLKSTSIVALVEKGLLVHKKIRYIKGCNEIYVDIQEKSNFTPNPSEDVIWLKNGRLSVTESGSTIGLYRFLKAHEGNVDNPTRPEGAYDRFREISTAVEAEETEDSYDADFEVMKYLNDLKVKKAGNTMVYEEDTLEFLASLFNLPTFESGYKSEAWVALASVAKANPELFLERIKGQRSMFESDVNKAVHIGAIVMDPMRAVFGAGNKLVMQFNGSDNENEKMEKLVNFMSNPKNSQFYEEMRKQTHAKREAAADVIQ